MMQNEWGGTTFPLVQAHEVIGRVTALGSNANGPQIGERVGVGWASASCMHCQPCLGGEQNLCPKRKLMAADSYRNYSRCDSRCGLY
ncbi:MAG: alcohol dehydrogenase catalytic domain-containing protein [Proteobacteria bacterium]|nr:alcohol dehydrogenase catalytic domain-containing protein [Pseudomonadota bacterium]